MKAAVTGGRDFKDREFVFETMDEIRRTHSLTLLIHGGATGVDSLCREWAESRAIPIKAFPISKATWQQQGMSAGPRRNALMIAEQPAYVVVFPGGRGTANMRKQAERAGIPVVLVDQRKQFSHSHG